MKRSAVLLSGAAIGFIAIAALTYWDGFTRGVNSQRDSIKAETEKALKLECVDELKWAIVILRAELKDTSLLAPSERDYWRGKLDEAISDTESFAIPSARAERD